jgi:TPR repeat protein
VRARACVRVCVCARACVRARVCARVCVRVCVNLEVKRPWRAAMLRRCCATCSRANLRSAALTLPREQEAAALGYGAAMNNLALLYLSGDHPAGRNVVEARKLLRKAAEEPSGNASTSVCVRARVHVFVRCRRGEVGGAGKETSGVACGCRRSSHRAAQARPVGTRW